MDCKWKKLTSALLSSLLIFNVAGQALVGFASEPASLDVPVAGESLPEKQDPEAKPAPEAPTAPETPDEEPKDPVTPTDPEATQPMVPVVPAEPSTPEGSDGEQNPETKTITQIVLPEGAVTVPANTAREQLPLPATLTVQLDGQEESVEAAVTWNCETYDAAVPGAYVFTAQLGEEYALAEAVTLPQVTVTVEEAIILPAKRYVYGEYSFLDRPEPSGISLFANGIYSESYSQQLSPMEKVIYDWVVANPTNPKPPEKGNFETYPIDLSAYARELTVTVDLEWEVRDGVNYYSLTGAAYEEYMNKLVESIKKATAAVYLDHPELNWLLNGGYSYGFDYSVQGEIHVNDLTATITLGPAAVGFVKPPFYDELSSINEVINSIVAGAQGKNRYDQVKHFHDEVAKLTEYNDAALDKNPSKDTEWLYAWSPYGVFAQKAEGVVCEGYARAFKMLCDRAGIPCALINGTGKGGAHMWNAVQMEDRNWYGVDVTWDDQDWGTLDTYFLKPVSDFEDHRPEPLQGLTCPELSDTPYAGPTDPTEPTLSVTAEPAGEGWVKGPVTVTVTVTGVPQEKTATCTYTDNDGAAQEITLSESGTGTVTIESDGEHKLTFTLKVDDKAVESATKTLNVKVDKTAPVIGEVSVEETTNLLTRANIVTNKQVKVAVTVTDETSGVESVQVQVGGDTYEKMTQGEGFTYTYIIDKVYENADVTVKAVDLAGNEATEEAKDTVTTDNVPPKITALSVEDITDTTATLKVTTDSNATLYYAVKKSGEELAEGEYKEATNASIQLTGLTANCGYTAYVYAEDAAGNRSGVSTTTFTTTKTQLKAEGTLTATGTYGDGWEKLTIDFSKVKVTTPDGQPINGTWSWKDKAAEKPTVSTTTATAVFTPEMTTNAYAELTKEVELTINQAKVDNVTNPGEQRIKADDPSNTADGLKGLLPEKVSVTTANGISAELPVTWSTSVPYDAKGKTYTYTGTISGNENIDVPEGKTASATVTVEPVSVTLPTLADVNVKWTGENSVSPKDIPLIPKSGTISVTGYEEHNVPYTLDWGDSKLDLTQEQVDKEPQTLNGTVTYPDAPAWLTLPESNGVTLNVKVVDKELATVTVTAPENLVYSKTPVADSAFAVSVTAGGSQKLTEDKLTFTYKSSDGQIISAPSAAGTYSVVVRYEDNDYLGTSEAVPFTIAPKPLTITAGDIKVEKTYDGSKTVEEKHVTGSLAAEDVLDGDVVRVSYTSAQFDSEKAGTRNVTFSGIQLDNTNYKPAQETLTANGVGTIQKAEPPYTVPSDLKALTNLQKTLADVSLPEGWAWKEPATELKADNANENPSYPAIFTPTDTENYAPVEENVSVAVSEIQVSGNVTNNLTLGNTCTLSHTATMVGADYTVLGGEYRVKDQSDVVSIEGNTAKAEKIGTAQIQWVCKINDKELIFTLDGAITVSYQAAPGEDTQTPTPSNPVVPVIPDEALPEGTNESDVQLKVEPEEAPAGLPTLPDDAKAAAYDIDLVKDSASVELSAPITVRMNVPGDFNPAKPFKLWFKTDSGSWSEVSASLKSAPVTFRAAGDGYYLEFPFGEHGVFALQYNLPSPPPAGGGSTGGSGSGSGSSGGHGSGSSDSDWEAPSSSDREFDKAVESFWEKIKDKIRSAKDGSTVIAKMYSDELTIPASVLKALQGKDVSLILRVKGQDDLVLCGKDLTGERFQGYYRIGALKRLANVVAEEEAPAAVKPANVSSVLTEDGVTVTEKQNPDTGALLWEVEAYALPDPLADRAPSAVEPPAQEAASEPVDTTVPAAQTASDITIYLIVAMILSGMGGVLLAWKRFQR